MVSLYISKTATEESTKTIQQQCNDKLQPVCDGDCNCCAVQAPFEVNAQEPGRPDMNAENDEKRSCCYPSDPLRKKETPPTFKHQPWPQSRHQTPNLKNKPSYKWTS